MRCSPTESFTISFRTRLRRLRAVAIRCLCARSFAEMQNRRLKFYTFGKSQRVRQSATHALGLSHNSNTAMTFARRERPAKPRISRLQAAPGELRAVATQPLRATLNALTLVRPEWGRGGFERGPAPWPGRWAW